METTPDRVRQKLHPVEELRSSQRKGGEEHWRWVGTEVLQAAVMAVEALGGLKLSGCQLKPERDRKEAREGFAGFL